MGQGNSAPQQPPVTAHAPPPPASAEPTTTVERTPERPSQQQDDAAFPAPQGGEVVADTPKMTQDGGFVATGTPSAALSTPPNRPAAPSVASASSLPSPLPAPSPTQAATKSSKQKVRVVLGAAPTNMKVWLSKAAGDPVSKLQCTELPLPVPGPGEVRVKVVCAGLNPVDYKRSGFQGLAGATIDFPAVIGVDCSGVIDAIGPHSPSSNSDWEPTVGDRVYLHNDLKHAYGTFAQYTIAPLASICQVADNVSFADAAAVPCAGWTAYVAIVDKLRLQRGQTIFVSGGAGGVGHYAINLAKLLGCRVITTCSPTNASHLMNHLGVDLCLDYNVLSSRQIVEHVMDFTKNAGADCALDCSGDSMHDVSKYAAMLKFGGHLACLTGVPNIAPETGFFTKQLSVHHVFLGGLHQNAKSQSILRFIGTVMMQMMADGVTMSDGKVKKLEAHVSELIQFNQVATALEIMQKGHTKGKIVVAFTHPSFAKKDFSKESSGEVPHKA